jgi:YfiH family protein
MSFVLNYGNQGVWYGTFSSFPNELVNHAISTRFGGTSEPPFHTMNLAMHNGDSLEKVILNRKIFCGSIGLDSDTLTTAEQIHSDNILYVNKSNVGKGAKFYADAIKTTDALITDCKNIPLMLFFADCVPVIIVDPVNKAIGISHAGWKGTVKKIAQKTVLAMGQQFNTKSQDCLIGIGPSIGACCYEVDDGVVKQFQQSFGEEANIFIKPFENKWTLDLWMANKLQLIEIGIKAENIDNSNICTACNSKIFFSYRADQGRTGRIAAVISLK